MEVRMATEVAKMAEPPIPCTARDPSSMGPDVERAERMEPTMKTKSPKMKMLRPPYISASLPKGINNAAEASM
jgi:hypothetical protein